MSFQLLNISHILSSLSYKGYVVVLDTVNSTNQYLMDNFSHLKLGSVCLAEVQTHGRGRYGKNWISPNNSFHLSFYWFFSNFNNNKNGKSVFVLSLVVSVVIAELLQKLGVKEVTLKWPNDIYVMGRKLAGVLIETFTTFNGFFHIVIGVGINLKMIFRSSKEGFSRIISLEEIGCFIDRNVLVLNVINILYKSLVQFERFGFLPFYFRWLDLDSCYNQSVKLLVGNRIIFGVSRGVDVDGSLLLERSGLISSYSLIQNISLRYCE